MAGSKLSPRALLRIGYLSAFLVDDGVLGDTLAKTDPERVLLLVSQLPKAAQDALREIVDWVEEYEKEEARAFH